MENTNTAVTAREDTIKNLLIKKQADIKQLLPAHVNIDRFIKSALLAVARDKNLQDCTPASLFTSVVNAAELGLDFTPAKGHAYLIPYKGQATFMPGYRGMIDLAKRSGNVSKIEAHPVHENDIFTIEYGLESKLIHKPCIRDNPGDIIGAYAIAWFKGEEPQYEFMTKKQLDGIRGRAKTDYIWKSDYGEMCRKTVVRRLFKYLPCSPDLEKAIEYDNAVTGIEEIEGNRTGVSRTASLAEMIAPDSDATDVDFEDVPTGVDNNPEKVMAPEQTTAPKSKADLIKAITAQNTDKYKQPDEVFLIIASKVTEAKVTDLEKLTKPQLEKLHEFLSDEDKVVALLNEVDGTNDLFTE